MILTSVKAESNVQADVAIPCVVVVPAGTMTIIRPSCTYGSNYKGAPIVYCYIQNIGQNQAYIAVGRDCDGVITKDGNVHVSVAPTQQLNVSEHMERITAFSAAGTTFSILQFVRKENPDVK